MDGRIARLESDVDYIKRDIGELKTDVREIRNHQERDFRLLFGAIILVALGIAGILAKAFGWIP